MTILKRVKRDFNIRLLRTTILVVAGAFLFNGIVSGADILRPLAMGEKQNKPNTPKPRALILLEDLRKEFASSLRRQTDIMDTAFLKRRSALLSPLNDTAEREMWAKLELRRLTVYSRNTFKLLGRVIAPENQQKFLELIDELSNPLSKAHIQELRYTYNQELLPAIDRLIFQYMASSLSAAATPLEQMLRAIKKADDITSSSVLRPQAAGERNAITPLSIRDLKEIANQPTIGQRLQLAMKYRKLTAQELSRISRVAEVAISGILMGKKRYLPETLKALADGLGINVNILKGILPTPQLEPAAHVDIILKDENKKETGGPAEAAAPETEESVYKKVLATLNASETPLTTKDISDALGINQPLIDEVIRGNAGLICHDNYIPEMMGEIFPPNLIRARANLDVAKLFYEYGFYNRAITLCHYAIDLSKTTLTRKPDISALSNETIQEAQGLLADYKQKGKAVKPKIEQATVFETLEAEFSDIRKWAAKKSISPKALRSIQKRLEACCEVIIDAAREEGLDTAVIELLKNGLIGRIDEFLSTLKIKSEIPTPENNPNLRPLLESI